MVCPRISSVVAVAALVCLLAPHSARADGSCTVFSQRVQCGSLACNPKTLKCAHCNVSADCYESALQCKSDGRCYIKPSFDMGVFRLVLAVLAGFGVCAVAVVAGIGGGGILVPAYVGILGVPLQNAVALSQATIAGQSFLNVMLLIGRHHPEYMPPGATRPLVNYEFLCLMLPISLVGTSVGNLVGKVVPDWLRLVLLFTLLGYILKRVMKRIRKQLMADAQARSSNTLLSSPPPHTSARDRIAIRNHELKEVEYMDNDVARMQEEEYQDLLLDEHSELTAQYPPMWIGFCAALWFVLLFDNVAKRSLVENSDCGGFVFWGLFFIPILISIGATLIVRHILLDRLHGIVDGTLPLEAVPFKWCTRTTVVFPIVSVFAGAAASLLGIGGGLVLNFLFLEANLHTSESSATSAVATLLVASESLAQFAIQGKIELDYTLLLMCAGGASTIVGQRYFVTYIKSTGKNYLTIVSLAAIIVGSLVSLSVLGVVDLYLTVKNHGSLGFGSMCSNAP